MDLVQVMEKTSRLRSRFFVGIVAELGIYAVVVVTYFVVVLSTLGGIFSELFSENLPVYSLIALTLIVIQGLALEFVTELLLRALRRSGLVQG